MQEKLFKAENYENDSNIIIDYFNSENSFLTAPNIQFSDYINHIQSIINYKYGQYLDYLPNIYKNIIMTAKWCGQEKYAKQELEKFYKHLARLNETENLEEWVKENQSYSSQDLIEQVENQKKLLSLENFKVFDFTFDHGKRLNIN